MILTNAEVRPFAITPPVLAAAPFVAITAAFAGGIAIALQFEPHVWLICAFIAIGIVGLALAIARREREAGWGWALLLLFALGAARTVAAAPVQGEASAARFVGRSVLLEGVVVEEPFDRSGTAVLRVWPTRLVADGVVTQVDDVVLLRIAEMGGQWRYGDVLQVEGDLEQPPRIEDFDYRMYLARQGVFAWMPRAENARRVDYAPPSVMWAHILDAKDALRRSVRDVVPAPDSALLNGILIGDDDAMPASLVEAFRRTGTSHIISISGFNVGVIVGMVLAVVRRLMHPRRAAPALLIVLWIYAAFVGASASVVRAVMMTSVALVGQWLWRRGFTLNTLCAAGFFMLLVQPFYLVDVGFQLSFGATLGLVLVADVLTSLVPPALMNMRLLGMVLEGVLLTTAAQITTLPLLLIHYEQLSLITLLTNGMVLPLQPPIMGLGMVAALAGVISRDIGTIVALPVFTLLRVSIRLIEITAAVPWAAISLGRFGAPWAVAYYAAMFGLLALQAVGPGVRQRGWRWLRPRLGRLGAAAGMAGVAAAVAAGVWSRPPAQAQVWLRGSSALLLAPDGAQIVVLGDGDPVGLVAQRLPWGDGAVDIAVLPRLDARAQEQALGFLRTYGAAELVIPPPAVLTDTVYQFWMQTPPAAIGRVRVVSGGEQDAAVWAAGGLRARAVALANDDLGNGILGLRLRGDAVRVDLFAAGELTSAALTEPGDEGGRRMLFAAPTTANQGMLRDVPIDWLIWSRAPRGGGAAAAAARRELDLSRWPWLGFRLEPEKIMLLP